MAITTKLYLGLPQEPDELLANGDFEDVTGDNFDDWTETTAAGSEQLTDGGLESWTGDDPDEWIAQTFGSGTTEEEGSEKHGGSHSAKQTTTLETDVSEIRQQLTGTAGKSYTLKAWVKGDYRLVISEIYPVFSVIAGTAADWQQVELTRVLETSTLWPASSLYGIAGGVGYVDDLSLLEDYAGVEEEGTIVHDGSHAVKLVGDGTIYQVAAANTAEARMSLSFWSKGDGTKGLKYIIYDVSNSAEILSDNAPIGTEWQKTTIQFYAPVDCESIRVTFDADGWGPFYVDDASLLEYGEPVFTDKSADVMSSPPIEWEYGINGTNPFSLLANTGIASFVLDNQDKEYSPSGGERIVGFEEGMDVKITLALDQTIDDDENLLENGSFEVLA